MVIYDELYNDKEIPKDLPNETMGMEFGLITIGAIAIILSWNAWRKKK